MKSLVLVALLFSTSPLVANSLNPNEKDSLEKAVTEIKANIEAEKALLTSIDLESKILVYDAEGNKIAEFTESNQDAKIMRNTDLVLESNTQKIFIKF